MTSLEPIIVYSIIFKINLFIKKAEIKLKNKQVRVWGMTSLELKAHASHWVLLLLLLIFFLKFWINERTALSFISLALFFIF